VYNSKAEGDEIEELKSGQQEKKGLDLSDE